MNRLRPTICLILTLLICACGIDVRLKDSSDPQPTSAAAASPTTASPIAASTAQPIMQLVAGQLVMTKPGKARDVWTAADGGKRLFERPKLYDGARVMILAVAAQAVQVRTEEGVEGWIHEPAGDALTSDSAAQGERARFVPGVQVQVIWKNGIPLRVVPRSDAKKVREQLKAGQHGTVQQLLGDWLRIVLDDGTSGWARWYYDGMRYVDVVPTTMISGRIASARLA